MRSTPALKGRDGSPLLCKTASRGGPRRAKATILPDGAGCWFWLPLSSRERGLGGEVRGYYNNVKRHGLSIERRHNGWKRLMLPILLDLLRVVNLRTLAAEVGDGAAHTFFQRN